MKASATIIQPRPGILKIPLYESGGKSIKNFKNPIKLSSNENPWGPGQSAIAAFVNAQRSLSTYPDSSHSKLRRAIGRVNDIDENRVICGAGSDEIIHFLCQCYAGSGDEVIHTEHGFLMYKISALAAGAIPISVPESNRRANIHNILQACNERTKLIFLANPNNPTGTLISAEEVVELIDGIPRHTLLIMDGAYAEYIDKFDAGLTLAEKHHNLFVLRTFSKIHGLASLRVGWGYGAQNVIQTLLRVKGPFNISLAGQEAATAAVLDTDHVKSSRIKNLDQRDKLVKELRKIGISCDRSFTNFVLARFRNSSISAAVDEFLKVNGLIVRDTKNYGLKSALRISVGTAEDCEKVVSHLKQFQEDMDAV